MELIEERKNIFISRFTNEISEDNRMLIASFSPRVICYSMNPDSILSSIQTRNIISRINIQNDKLIILDSELIGQNLKCELTDINGKLINKFELSILNNITEYLLPIQNLPSGLYLLNISTNNFNQTFKILRDR